MKLVLGLCGERLTATQLAPDLHVAGPVSFTEETIGCASKGISALNQNQQAEQVRNIG